VPLKTTRRFQTVIYLFVSALLLIVEVPQLFHPDDLHSYRIGIVVLAGAMALWMLWRMLTGRDL